MADVCAATQVPTDVVYRMDTCLSEILANVIMHGGEEAKRHPVRVVLKISCDDGTGHAQLTVADRGCPFNPVVAATRTRATTLADATPGGLGLMMIRTSSDAQYYDRADGDNRLSLSFQWPSPC